VPNESEPTRQPPAPALKNEPSDEPTPASSQARTGGGGDGETGWYEFLDASAVRFVLVLLGIGAVILAIFLYLIIAMHPTYTPS
jgi:hypothetical protein